MDGAKPISIPLVVSKQLSFHDGDALSNPKFYKNVVGAL